MAGLTTIQGFEIVRGCKGLNIVGADLVEVMMSSDVTLCPTHFFVGQSVL